MSEMSDHDRINTLQASVVGLRHAAQELLEALGALADADPDVHLDVKAHLQMARLHMDAADILTREARSIGEARAREVSGGHAAREGLPVNDGTTPG